MTIQNYSLRDLGWSPFFQSQIDVDEPGAFQPARISAVHRNSVEVITPRERRRINTDHNLSSDQLAVGDWVLLGDLSDRVVRLLERKTVLKRRAAGTAHDSQLIASNIDTLFIVSSCNDDFNPARLERYLALAAQAGVMPVLVLTRADLCEDAPEFEARAARVAGGLVTEVLDATDPVQVARLVPWCGEGQTVAFVGSSGVGKSTLANTLSGSEQRTNGIREDDSRGRHTTTSRSLHSMKSGGWLVDTPGMRALRLYDAGEGLAAVFDDIENLAGDCRFGDCSHEQEPGCAVRLTIERGELDAGRLRRWNKLRREDMRNSAGIAERRQSSKALARHYRTTQSGARRRKGDQD